MLHNNIFLILMTSHAIHWFCSIESLHRLFTDIKFSESGSNSRKEEATSMYFINFFR